MILRILIWAAALFLLLRWTLRKLGFRHSLPRARRRPRDPLQSAKPAQVINVRSVKRTPPDPGGPGSSPTA